MRMQVRDSRGFTLAEVLVASTISAFIALVAVGALKAVTDGAQAVSRATETAAELRFAARMMARDLANLYRHPDARNMRLVGTSQASDMGGPAFLMFYMVGRAKARPDQPEGDVYEVEYVLGTSGNFDMDRATGETPESVLFRRLWPNPDKDRPPAGVLTPIMENLAVFQMRFFDGQEWADEWPEQMESIPQLIEITLAARPKDGREPVVQTLMVNFPRLVTPGTVPQAGGESAGEGPGQAPAPEPGGSPDTSGGPTSR